MRAALSLIRALSSKDGNARERARRGLVAIGRPAALALATLLHKKDTQLRREAAKVLAAIADPATAPALVRALGDSDLELRGIAAEGLIVMGRPGIEEVLRGLVWAPYSVWFREGAHHVLSTLSGRARAIQPVLDALAGANWQEMAPLAAEKALAALRKDEPQ